MPAAQGPDLADAVAAGRVTPISVGPTCTASELLEHLGLRQAAYPFDWLISSLGMVEHCLDDDFATFLDRGQHRWRGKRQSDHAFYREAFGLEAVFHHHPMPRELAHFERTVERFRTAPNPVFVYMAVDEATDPAALERVRRKLRGPLLAYVLTTPGFELPARSDLVAVRWRTGWDHDVFPQEADVSGMSGRLCSDILEAAARVPIRRLVSGGSSSGAAALDGDPDAAEGVAG
jgi:hypothetical protein